MSSKQIHVLSGLAGAGKSTAANALEDAGFFVVDNLPPQLMLKLVELADSSGGELRRLAFVVDARETAFLQRFGDVWDVLSKMGHDLRLTFLDCDDDVLVRRFKETRRIHPLDEGDGIAAAIARERALLFDILQRADEVIQTTRLSVHDLSREMKARIGDDDAKKSQVTVLSFGFKHGLPPELDLCFDVRFLPNPYFVQELRHQTGVDDAVYDHVMKSADAVAFLDQIEEMVRFLLPRFFHEGKSYVTVAIGCTGGHHRSVSIARALSARLHDVEHRLVHRDRER